MRNKIIISLPFASTLLPNTALAWNGYDYEASNYIEYKGFTL